MRFSVILAINPMVQAALDLGIPNIVSFDAHLDEIGSWQRIGKPDDVRT